jgi:transmembrane sensor
MSKDYNDFSATDFVEDPFFKQWVLENHVEATQFWTLFMANHPDKVAVIEDAREALRVMSALPERDTTAKMAEQASTIKKNIEKAIHYPFLHASRFDSRSTRRKSNATTRLLSVRSLGIAAALLIGIGSLLVLSRIKNYRERSAPETETIVETSPKGKRSLINLPDGSTVWLNAESQLIYSNDFRDRDTREVFLIGEAFFDVTEDELKPFIVITSSIAIKVYGTAFNVKSYNGDKTIETTLLKGKIGISLIGGEGYDGDQVETALLPNQQAVFIKESQKLVLQNNIEAEVYSGWRAGKLYFDNKPITEILANIERWYNVRIHLENVPSERCTFSAKIDNKTLTEVLELFRTTTDDSMRYEIKNKDVYIKGKLCE